MHQQSGGILGKGRETHEQPGYHQVLALSGLVTARVMREATSAECQNIQMQRGKALHRAALFSSSQTPRVWRYRDAGAAPAASGCLALWSHNERRSAKLYSCKPNPHKRTLFFSYVVQKLSSFQNNFSISLCVSRCKPRKYYPL